MKASKAEAKKAIAAQTQAEEIAELGRKVSLIMDHLKIVDLGPEDDDTADVPARPAPAPAPPVPSKPAPPVPAPAAKAVPVPSKPAK